MANTHKHTLTFEGDVPADEMERATLFAHPEIQAARTALVEAFKKAGHPHTASSKTVKPKKATPAPAPAPARHAAE